MKIIGVDFIVVWIFCSFNDVFISSYSFKVFWKLIGLLNNYHNSCNPKRLTLRSHDNHKKLLNLSSIWWTMFGHAIQKAFSTSLGSISTIGAFDTSTTCEAYASHIAHPLQCVVVINWGNHGCPMSWTLVQLQRSLPLLLAVWSLLMVFLPKACMQQSLCRRSLALSFEAIAIESVMRGKLDKYKRECVVWMWLSLVTVWW